MDSNIENIGGDISLEEIDQLISNADNLWSEDPDLGIDYGNEALSLAYSAKSKDRVAAAHNSLGKNYYTKGYEGRSLDAFYKARKLYEHLNNKVELASVTNNIAMVYETQELYSKAIEFCEESLKLFQEESRFDKVALLYTNIGVLYRREHKWNEAKEMFEKSLEIYKSYRIEDSTQVITLRNLGLFYLNDGDYRRSYQLLVESLDLSLKNRNLREKARSYHALSRYHNVTGDQHKSYDLCLKALVISRQMRSLKLEMKSYKLLSKIAEKQGKYDQAFKYLYSYTELFEKLTQERQKFQVDKIKANYDMLNRERDTVSAMAITVNHELNQPLTTITGYKDMLFESYSSKGQVDQQQIKYFRNMDKSLDTINEILEKFSKFTSYTIDDYIDQSKFFSFGHKEPDPLDHNESFFYDIE